MSGSGTDEEDEEIDYQAVACRVAEVTLESDSLPETPSARRVRRKKRVQKRPKQMEIDQPTFATPTSTSRLEAKNASMDWEGDSDVGSSDSHSSCGRDADDEQSDWVGYSVVENVEELTSLTDRRRMRMKPPSAMSTIQRKLERFSKDPDCAELSIDIRVNERTNNLQFNRLLQLYKMEVVRRHRGNVVLKRKKLALSCPEDRIDEC